MSAARTLRQALTIARRDFVATVFTPTFLLFLFAPLLMVGLGLIGGLGASSAASGARDEQRIVAIAAPADGRAMTIADARLRRVFRRDEAPPALMIAAPAPDPAAQARGFADNPHFEASAILYGPADKPVILVSARGARSADYLAELAEQAARAKRTGDAPLTEARRVPLERAGPTGSGRSQAGFFAAFGVFFLTILLAGQAVGTMAEEKSNKVIEVLAAAVPLESVFLGKLIGMFGSACLFVGFWGTVALNVGSLIPPEAARAFAGVGPAVGAPMFTILFLTYFALAYMLLGAVFLGVGAQASTIREIQMLSLPITFVQVAMFGLASAAANNPGSTLATAAEMFPLSSPFAMAARAANRPELWPHAAAIAWQLLWVSIVIAVAARAFRRGVLQSGPGARRKRAATVDMDVS